MVDSRTILKNTLRVVATLVVVCLACVLGWFAWQHYVYAPWTRDARVQAAVINIAPEISGTVKEVAVTNNGYVHKGDLLFRINPVRFKNAVDEGKAALAKAKAQQKFARQNAKRLEKLPGGSVSMQERQKAQSEEHAANAAVAEARAQLVQARQNLKWATVRSPVEGYVTHLMLHEGDYTTQGQSAMVIVDAKTFCVIGYFEETKLGKIDVGDPVDIHLMAGDLTLKGHVASIGRGIAVDNNTSGERNLPDVNPTFQWVRLAQRIPVTIAFDKPPQTLPLSVGLSATVRVTPRESSSGSQAGDS